jgi:hypothetical protein
VGRSYLCGVHPVALHIRIPLIPIAGIFERYTGRSYLHKQRFDIILRPTDYPKRIYRAELFVCLLHSCVEFRY